MQANTLLQGLNREQQEAVKATEGPVLVLAGAGSGKTRVLTYRIAYLIEKKLASPGEILAVTFTNKAANEMKTRVENVLLEPVRSLWIGTFHSICARILHSTAKYAGHASNFSIYDVDDQVNQIKRIMDFLSISRESLNPKAVQYAISQAKNSLKDPRQYEKEAADLRQKNISKIYWDYEAALRKNNAFDFDDLLIKPIEIFTSHPEILEQYQNRFRYILVDEYQDTNKAQYYLIKMLGARRQNICVVGDEDQSIYRWRGAEVENILNFESDFTQTTVVRLEQNYRSTQNILNAANMMVRHNEKRLGKNLWSDKGTGEKIKLIQTPDESAESKAVVEAIQKYVSESDTSLNDVAILYRTNAQSRALEEQLRYRNIPYSIVGGTKFYERKEIKDVLAYLRLMVNPQDAVSLRRIINFPARGIGDVSLKALDDFAYRHNTSLFEALGQVDLITELNSGSAKKMKGFFKTLEHLKNQAAKLSALELAEKIIKEFGLKAIYENSDRVEDEARIENINELLNSIEIFMGRNPDENGIDKYLEEVSLLSDIDRWDPTNATVTLMTLHSAKGLEFPVVFITGLEDGLFPLSRTYDNPDDLEEERRLFYVGLTRAQERLYLLYAQTRHRFASGDYGSSFRSVPSRFLSEIPSEYLEKETWSTYTYGGYDRMRQKKRRIYQQKYHDSPTAELPDEDSPYKIGQWVKHDEFGTGQILGVEVSNLGTKLTIHFGNRQIRKLIAEYANLEIRNEVE